MLYITEEIRIKKKELGQKGWQNRSCTKRKRAVHRKFKSWKRDRIYKEEYTEEKRTFNEYLKERQEEQRKEEEMELKNLRNTVEIWKYINKKREKRELIENNIGKEDWERHFRNLLEEKSEEIKGKEEKEEGVKRK